MPATRSSSPAGRPGLKPRPAGTCRRLGCWCLPQSCHAEVIAELADSEEASRRQATFRSVAKPPARPGSAPK
ncbi:DUF4326 domain-containing protein [Streptomyces sp. 11-1-2]|uniref:DUF4326 domain-containing protein n=1 Tax=unclassified Streptomyces TaxID=2593676 RepID=UPI001F09C4AC|nr:DUF4326 domain-containing protein [Streptomyces sp. 11-1-2]